MHRRAGRLRGRQHPHRSLDPVAEGMGDERVGALLVKRVGVGLATGVVFLLLRSSAGWTAMWLPSSSRSAN